MQIARAFSSKRKENVARIVVMLGVVRVLGVAGHLSSLRMASLVRRPGRRENKVAKDRPVRGREKGNKDIGAFAWGNKGGALAIGGLPLMYYGCSLFEWVPVMNISGGLGHFVRDEKGNLMRWEIT